MQVIKNGSIAEDSWFDVADDAALPDAGDVIVSWQRWTTESETLRQWKGRLGLRVTGALAVADLGEVCDNFPLIALDFVKFGDGRCFTHARVLRERYGYRGELRAVGYVMRDLLFYMRRCGIDSFVLREGQDVAGALAAFNDFSLSYQTATDNVPTILQRRR